MSAHVSLAVTELFVLHLLCSGANVFFFALAALLLIIFILW